MPVIQVFRAMWRSRIKRKRGNASETPTRHSATTGTHRDDIRRRLPSLRMKTRTTTAETRTSAQAKAEMGDPVRDGQAFRGPHVEVGPPDSSYGHRTERRGGDWHVTTGSAFKSVPEFARGQVARPACALGWRKPACRTGRAFSSRAIIKTSPTIGRCILSVRCRFSRKTGSSCSSLAPLCCTSGSAGVALLPQESEARARAVKWLVAALNSIEALHVEPGVDRHTLRQRCPLAGLPEPHIER